MIGQSLPPTQGLALHSHVTSACPSASLGGSLLVDSCVILKSKGSLTVCSRLLWQQTLTGTSVNLFVTSVFRPTVGLVMLGCCGCRV